MSQVAAPTVHRWTRHEYEKMVEVGLFEGKRVELIEGQVIEMAPMLSAHATAVALTAKTVEQAFGAGYFVRWQMPFAVGELSEPEPDLAVIVGDIRDYTDEHPTRAALIIEVADTSLRYDREDKASLYAKAGVADYWVLNLNARQFEVRRKPVKDQTKRYGFGYAETAVFRPTDSVSPLAKPQTTIAVAALLP